MNRVRKIVPIVLLLVLAFAGVLYSNQKKAAAPTNENQQASVAQKPDASQPIFYQGEEGKTAMAILKAKHQVATRNYSFGEMVTAIDGVEPDSKHFWGFYINGSLAQIGADAYVTKASDKIEWKLEEIK